MMDSMSLGVFELGLRNQQLSTVRCFLKIQAEALRILLRKESSGITKGNNSHSLTSAKHLLQWLDIFAKLSQVITSSLRDRTSSSNQSFGRNLASLALNVGSSIISILHESRQIPDDEEEGAEDEGSFHPLDNQEFSGQLLKHISVIREASFGGYSHRQPLSSRLQKPVPVAVEARVLNKKRSWGSQDKDRGSRQENAEDSCEVKLDNNSSPSSPTGQEIISSLLNDLCLHADSGEKTNLLKQQLLWRKTGVQISWKSLQSLLVDLSLKQIKEGKSSQAAHLLSLVNISLKDMMPAVVQQSFHPLISTTSEISSKIALLMDTYSDISTFTVSQECLDLLKDDVKVYLLPRLFEHGEESNEYDSTTILSTLVSFNEVQRLVDWVKGMKNLSPALLKLDIEGHALTREKLSSALLQKSWSLRPELLLESGKSIEELVRQFYRNGMSIFSESASKFLPSIRHYFNHNELHELNLWLPTRVTGLDEQEFLSGAETSLSFALVQRCAEIVSGKKGDQIWTEVDDQVIQVAGLFCSPPLPLQLLSSHASEIILSFPFIAKSLPSFGVVAEDTEDSCSSMYYVLRKSTSLDMRKCFMWQDNNLFRDRQQDLPSFARHLIPGFKGIDTSIDTIYFIREGRPSHAFCRGDSSQVQNKMTDCVDIAFSLGSKRIEVLCSDVIFHEIVLQNSWSLRFHLSAANFIGKYAADFLGLKLRQQENALGTLLKACMKKTPMKSEEGEDASVIKMLSLLVAAFERKYHEKRKISVDECLEWELVHHFCQEHSLDPACELLVKCAQNDDWLLFVVSAQIYDMPKDIVLNLLSSFNNRCIADHLEKAFRSSSTSNEKDENPVVILKGKEKGSGSHLASSSRQSLYSKIGVITAMDEARKRTSFAAPSTPESPDCVMNNPFGDLRSNSSDADERFTCMTDTLSVVSRGSGDTSSTGLDNIANLPTPVDLYNLILEAQKRTHHSFEETLLAYGVHLKNSILVLFSASLNPAMQPSSFDILSFWLSSAFKPTTYSIPLNESWTSRKFCSLLWAGIQSLPNLRTLRMGLQLFDYERNPFFLLVQFLIEFALEKKLTKSVDLLKSFQDSYWKFTANIPSNPLENITDMSVICVALIEVCLTSLEDFHETRLLLRHLDFARIQSMFPPTTKVPNFNRLSRMCQAVQETDTEIPVGSLIRLPDVSDEFKQIADNLCKTLQEDGYFTEANQLAVLTGLEMDLIVINEWRIKSKSNLNDVSFWKNVFNYLSNSVKDNSLVLNFLFEFEQDPTCGPAVRLLIFCYLYGFICDVDDEKAAKIEQSVFELLLELESSVGDNESQLKEVWNTLCLSMKRIQSIEHPIPVREEGIEEEKKLVLDKIIGKINSLDTAIRFSTYFGYHSKDADILQVCHSLATNGSLKLEDLDNCLDCLSPRLKEKKNQDLEVTDILVIMDELVQKSSYAKSICQKTVLQFKISVALGKPFYEVNREADHMTIIRKLISAAGSSASLSTPLFTSSDLITLAKEFISCHKIEDQVVVKLVMHEVLIGMNPDIKDTASSVESSASGQEAGSGTGFLSLLRLMNDPSVLGRHILLHLRGGFLDDQPLSLAVELYIRAHDCFSVCCDIEGISLVLRNSKQLVVQQLAPSNDYYGMIRLLTGIGRYSEMTYIFDLLREHHKFELLLGKRIEKVPQLRVALLDSLKGDKEMYPLVALNFSMHREIAEMLEADAVKTMKNMSVKKSLNAKDLLERCMADLVDASDSFSKASCYSQSRRCALLADLVALQVSFLSKDIDVLLLTPQLVSDFIIRHPNCAEAMIVAEAYGHQRSWSAALFNHVIKRGDWTYFREYMSLTGSISSTVLDEIVFKALHELPTLSGTSAEGNLVKLINTCRGDMEGTYRVTQRFKQIQMKDFIKKINLPNEGDESVYFQDLIKTSSSNF